ncbi:hypothetical protein KBI23_10000 [bacterium]|nr:hypothetical protein [bacterium]MBP9808619.1 hypothetical protein [bacterium]
MSRVGRESGESPSSRQENFSPRADDDSEQNNDKASQRLLTEANRGLDLGFLISRNETNNTPQESATSEHLGLAKKLLGKDLENILQIDSASGKPQSKNPLVQQYFERQEAGDQKAAERALLQLGHEAIGSKSNEAKSALAALQLVEAMSKLQKGASADDIPLSQRGLTELAKLAKPGNTAEFILDNYANGKDGHNPLRDAQVKWARTAAQGGDDAVSAAAEKSFTQVLNPAGAEAKTKALIDLTIANYTLSPEARREQAPLMHLAQALDTASAIDETIQNAGHPNRLEKSLNMALKLEQSGNQPAAAMLNAIGVHSKADAHNLVQQLSQPGGRALTDLQSNLRDWQSSQGYSTAPRDTTPTASTEKIYQDFFKNPNIPDNVKEKIDSPAILRVPPGSADLRDLSHVHKDDVHTRNDILTRHYLSGDQNARQAALDGLRREVQQGNLSAMQRLTELSLFDGSLKLADANRRINQAQDPVAQQKAIEDQQQALNDLAIMELGDKKRQSGISDLLDHAPAMGVSKAEIDQARREAASEEKAQTELATKVLDQAVRGTATGEASNNSRNNNNTNRDALSQLEQVDSEPDSTAKMVSKYLSGSGQENRRVVEFAHGTRDAKELAEALDNPERAAAALRKIDRLARQGNSTADGIMRSLNGDQAGQEMLQALKKGNEKTFKENLQKPEVVEAIHRALEPSLKLSQELKIVKAEDLLKAFADPVALETAREEARKFSKANFDSADQALANFSKRNQSSEQRQEALNNLLETSDKRLKHFNDYAFESVRLNLESIDAVKKVHEAINKAAQTDAKDGHLQVATALKDLQKMAYDGNHNLAHRYLNNLRGDNNQFNLEDLTKRLESGDSQVLSDITTHLPTGERELNDYRANRIVRNLGPDSSLEALTAARQQLEEEIKQDKNNLNAQEWLKWTSSAQNVSQLSLAASNKDLPKAEKAIAELNMAANNGDGFARASLAATLLGRSDTQGKAVFETAGFGKTADKPTYIANLKGLPAAEAEQLMLKAIEGLEQALPQGSEEKGKKLSVEEAGTLAVALVQARAERETSSSANNNDKNNSADKPMASSKVAAAIESALTKAIDGPSRSNVMESIFSTIRHELPGANHLSSLYIEGSASDPILAKHFDSLAQWARLGDDASLSILAGITSGAADDNSIANPLSYVGQGQDEKPIYRAKDPIADKAKNILTAISEQADKQEKVIDSLIAVYDKTGDKNQLLSTLGAIAAKVENAPIEKVRSVLHKGIENLRDSKETDPSANKSHTSAVAGLMSMAKHWNQSDIKLVQDHLTPTMISGLRKSAPDVPQEQRRELATALEAKLTSKETDAKANSERLSALKAMGSLGQSLDSAQVKAIALFGGKSGQESLSKLGINGEAAIEFQAQAGKALLRVVSMADNARPGREGPREIAYKAFKDNAWPNLDEAKGEQQSIIDSSGKTREPRDLREALLNYAEGRPFDISLSKEISRIVYDAGLKRPPAGILQDWGVPAENPDALFVKADRIVSNYTSKESSGEEVLKRVASNIDLVNSLPPDLRLKVTGNQEPVDKAQVAGQMLNATLAESRNKALLEDLPKQLASLSLVASKEVADLTKEHTTLRREQSHNLALLSDHTKEGVSFGRRITSVFGDDTIDKFEEKQVSLVKQLPVLNIKSELKAQELSEVGQKKHVLDLAMQIGNHTDLENKGRQKEADQLALSMWQEHGAMLQKLAPTVWRDLVASDGQQVGRSALGRLKDASMGQFDTVPNYDSGSKGFKEALKTLEDIKYKQVRAPEGFTYTAEFADTAAMRAHALHRLSDDDAFRGLDKVSKTFNQALPELSAMVDAAQKGTKFDTFVASAQDKAAMLKNAMNSVTKEELADVRERITSMQEVADRMKANKADSNPEALAGLNARIATYKQMHDMLNPEPSVNFNPDKNVNSQLKTLIDKVTDPNFKPDTFANWAKTNGPVIAATVVAVAATVAACATFGVSSPLAVAAWASVAGLAASELTKEGLYQVNSNLGYSGFGVYGERSKAGAWSAKIGERDSWENVKTLATEVAGPYAGQVVFDTALALGTMGLAKYALSGFSTKTLSTESMKQLIVGEGKSMAQLAAQSERAALMAQGDSTAAHFMRDYMKNLGKEVLINSGFTAAQMSLEKGIEAVTPEQLKSMLHEGNTGVSFGISTSLAIGQGLLASLRHGRGGKINFEAKSPEGEKAFIEFYRKEGFDVKPILAPGESKAARWEVRSFNQLPGQSPFVLERGTGLPEKDLFPGGAKTVAKLEGAKKLELPIEVEAHGEKWRQTEAGQKMIGELEHYSEAFMKGDFQKALAIATDKSSGPANYEIKKHPVEISLEALSNPSNADKNLVNALKDMGDVSKASRREGKLLAELPQPILEIETNVKVDLFDSSAKTIDGKALSAEQQKKLADFKASDSGQRILQEMAINSMEERIHLRQLEMDGKVVSPSYVKFIADSPNPSPDQLNALRGKYDNAHSESGGRSAATMEQEAILALHDSDPQRWNAKNLRHHFGNQHADVREPLFKWLENQQALPAVHPTAEIVAACNHITSRQNRTKGLLTAPEAQETAALASKTLGELLLSSKVHPDTAMDIADAMMIMARENITVTPEAVKSLSQLPPGDLPGLTKEHLHTLINALKYKMVDGVALAKGIPNAAEYFAALAPNVTAVSEVVSAAKGHRPAALIDELASLQVDQIKALGGLYKNKQISDKSLSSAVELINGKTLDSRLSKIISHEEVTQLLSQPGKGTKTFEAIMLAESLQQTHNTNRSPDIVRSLLTVEPNTAMHIAETFGNAVVQSKHIEKFIDSVKLLDSRSSELSAMNLTRLAQNKDRYSEIAGTIFSDHSPQTLKHILDIAANTDANKTLLSEISAYRESSAGQAKLIDAIMQKSSSVLAKSPTTLERLETLKAIKNVELNSNEMNLLTSKLQTQQLSPTDVTRFTKLNINGKKVAAELFDSTMPALKNERIFELAEAANAKPIELKKINSLIARLDPSDQQAISEHLFNQREKAATIHQRLASLRHLEDFIFTQKHQLNQDHIGKIAQNCTEATGTQLEYFAHHLPELLANTKIDGTTLTLASSPEILALGSGGGEKVEAIRKRIDLGEITDVKSAEEALIGLRSEKPILTVMADKVVLAEQHGSLGYREGGTNNENGTQMRGTLGLPAYANSGQLRAVYNMMNEPYYARDLAGNKFAGVIEFGSNGRATQSIPLNKVKKMGWLLILD